MKKSLKALTTPGTSLQNGLGASPRSLVTVLILATSIMVAGNAHAMTAGQQPEGPDSASSLRFDGIDDRVTVPYNTSFPTEVFTASAWIKLAQPTGRAAIIARGEDDNSFNLSWQLYVTRDGTLEVMLEDSNENNYCYPLNNCAPMGTCEVTGDLFVADDTWHLVAVTRHASGDLAVYIDGEKRGGCEGTGVPSSNNFQDLSVGCTFGTIGPPPGGIEPPIWFFPGLIDQPAMWNVALSDSQIMDLFSFGIDLLSTGLVGNWAFDEGAGQVVTDLSPAGNDGFLGTTPDVDGADPLWEADPVSVGEVPELKPETFRLEQNYPNPFNPTTQIQFSLSRESDIRLVVFDLLGWQVQILAEGKHEAGSYSVTFDGANLPSGFYLYKLQAGSQRLTGKMILMK